MERHELSAAEKCIIVNTHHYLKVNKPKPSIFKLPALRQRVADCVVFTKSTIARVMAHWNRHHDTLFTASQHPIRERPPPAGEKYAGKIREIVDADLAIYYNIGFCIYRS
jgi:hypothetical protein